jgi:phage gp45-like
MMIRATIISVLEGAIKLFSGTAGQSGTLTGREAFQHYGFTSRAKAGAEAIVVRNGNIFISIAEDDRRYRLAVAEGEVALYSDEGDKILLKRGRNIEITSGTKVKIIAPATEITGNLTVGGNVQASGNVQDAAGTMAAQRLAYNAHVHTDPQGGSSGPALPLM